MLFVGNSLTYTHDLPGMLTQVAKAYGQEVDTECLCLPNYAVVDHLDFGPLEHKLLNEDWDYVVVQQGPSSQAEGFDLLLEAGEKIQAILASKDTQLVFFMVWPSRLYYHTFDGVVSHYGEAASACGADLVPVGIHWQDYQVEYDSWELYGPDGFHPSVAGSFLSVLCFIQFLWPTQDIRALAYFSYSKWVDKVTFQKIVKVVWEE
ncbi:MAG TPA: hypothetical protein DCE41_00025 [Cytophagales bacterium]|nr:hypothetical protein [Cytophagales bacterium]